ncbi:hypothetical protein K9M59_02225 [Candidatus Gracilibacteria bacterium]|nr:hypothetical protein [Candidatus Gracilibacteria bacterium]MCF7819659.1 hypothetical protein [Candidatus Gracilibacteria bacterium]
MKKFFINVFVLSFLFFGFAEAANITSRFRGSGSRYAEKIDSFTRQVRSSKLPNYSRYRPRLRSEFLRTSQTVDEEQSESFLENRMSRRRTFSQRLRPYSRSSVPTVEDVSNRTEEDFEVFSARDIAFSIILPQEFEVTQDTLYWNEGKFYFEDEDGVQIQIHATDKRCDGGITFVRHCLEKESNEFISRLKDQFVTIRLTENKEVDLFSTANVNRRQKGNISRWVQMSSPKYQAAHLTFFDPIRDFVWEMTILDPTSDKKILKDNRILQRVLTSLVENEGQNNAQLQSKINRFSQIQVPEKRSDRGTYVQSKNPIRLDDSQTKVFHAQKVPFKIELPSSFLLQSDTADWNQGEIVFQGDDGSVIRILPSNETCQDQTPRLKRRCLEKNSDAFLKEFKTDHPSLQLLKENNMLLQLDDADDSRTQNYKNDIARFVLLRETGKRIALFTFIEPIQNYFVWRIEIESPEKKDAFLNDIRQANNTFSSLFFEEPEKQ